MAKTHMTPQDLVDARPIADRIIEMTTAAGIRPPTAVAAVALALAASAHLAECGPIAATELFDSFYRQLGDALAGDPPPRPMGSAAEVNAAFLAEHAEFHRRWSEAVGTPGYDKRTWVAESNAFDKRWRDAATAAGYPPSQPLVPPPKDTAS